MSKTTHPIFIKFSMIHVTRLPVAMAWSSSDDNAISYAPLVFVHDVMVSHNAANGAESINVMFG